MSAYDDFKLSQDQEQKAARVHLSRARKRPKHHKGGGGGGGGATAPEPSLTDALTPQGLKKELNAALKLQYGPQQSELNTQIKSAAQRQTDISGWYKQYLDAVHGAQFGNAVNYGAAEAAVRQATPAATGDALTDQAALSRNALTNSFADMIKTQGLAQGANYQNQAIQAPIMEAGSHIEQGRYQDKLKTGLSDLLAQKGAFATDYRSKARTSERDWLATQAASEMAGVKLQNTLDQQSTTNKRNRKRDRAADANTQADNTRADNALGDARSRDAYQRAHHTGPYKPAADPKANGKDKYGNTPRQRHAANSAWSKAKVNAKFTYSKGITVKQLYEQMIALNPSLDSDMALGAAERQVKGHTSHKTRKRLREQGVHFKKPKAKPKQNSYGDTNAPGAGH